MKKEELPKTFPEQEQTPPGIQKKMNPVPITDDPEYIGTGKLKDKVAIVTGGDSGIGQASAIILAKEGADVVVVYLSEHKDAEVTKEKIEEKGRSCLLLSGDVGNSKFCKKIIKKTLNKFGKIDILVNNAAEQTLQGSITDVSDKQLTNTFKTNFFGYFYLTREVVEHLNEESSIINITSVTAYQGSPALLDYSSTKGAIVSFTRSLALALAKKKIRVNGVAPGPIWTPLIISSITGEDSKYFGTNVPLGRAGQPFEVATSVAFLASKDSSYMTGQVLHPNGGEIING